ncbi:MAG: DNA polymerase III subunit epsilon [Pseudomonadota bacterium]
MREIIFDTETTGLDNREDRIIEIGAVEMENRFITGRNFHVFINPQGRQVHPDALNVHGISNEMLEDKPTFAQIIDEWFTFVGDAKLIAHNANFDVGFFNAEFERVGFPKIDPDRVIDSLALARRRHPMGPNSLDALCKRYGVDNSRRDKHGALLDSELLADVYIELVGGKQATLTLSAATSSQNQDASNSAAAADVRLPERSVPLEPRLNEKEKAAHAEMVERLGDSAIWKKLAAQS